MNPEFWHQKWAQNEIGFHQPAPNPLLIAHFQTLELRAKARVFVPLCGKSLDMAWLLSQGVQVVGVELSEQAVIDFFKEAGIAPNVAEVGAFTTYSHEGIEIFVGDIFDLSSEVLWHLDAVYDRAALVALPQDLRVRYADKLARISGFAPQLVITFSYDQTVMNGPPFSVPEATVQTLYGDRFSLHKLQEIAVEGGLKGRCPAMETVWHLTKI